MSYSLQHPSNSKTSLPTYFHRLVVSLTLDLSSPGDEALHAFEEKGVKGRYVSVERVMELENGNTEWRMAVSSTPGGSIPTYFVESTMPKTIASVNCFECWTCSPSVADRC